MSERTLRVLVRDPFNQGRIERLGNIYRVLSQILDESLDTVDIRDTSSEGWQLYGIQVHGNNLTHLRIWRSILRAEYPRIMASFYPVFFDDWTASVWIDHLNEEDVYILKYFFEKNDIPSDDTGRDLELDVQLTPESKDELVRYVQHFTRAMRAIPNFCRDHRDIWENLEETEQLALGCEENDGDIPIAHVIPQETIRANLLKRARELEEEEYDAKRLRRQSDPRIQLCEKMNRDCKYKPLDFGDWCEDHDPNHFYGPDPSRRCFDALELLQFFENQFLVKKYGNFAPQYPHDPFSRENFTLSELHEFDEFCTKAGIDVARVAPTFAKFLTWVETYARKHEIDGKGFTYEIQMDVVDRVVKVSQQHPSEQHPSQQHGGGLFSFLKPIFGNIV